jgi:hypothetical protein
MDRIDYGDLAVYVGPQISCLQCGREFLQGQVITVTDGGAGVFCLTEPDSGGCMEDYLILTARSYQHVVGRPMAYRARNVSGQATPVPDRPNGWLIALAITCGVTAVFAAVWFLAGFVSP